MARPAIRAAMLAWGFLLAAATAWGARVSVEIQGLEEELHEAVRARLSLAEYAERSATQAQVRLLFQDAEAEIREALEPFGYYNPRVRSELRAPGAGEFVARFDIDAGPPTIVRDLQIEVAGTADEIRNVRAAIESFSPADGEQLDHGAYEGSKAAIATALQGSGYFDARPLEHRVTVHADDNAAEIDLVYESGARYRFGAVRFGETAQFPREFLRGYVPWRPGDYYSAEEVLNLQQRLVDADYFSVVSVQPEIDEAAAGSVPVTVVLMPDERTVYTGELFYSTDFGPGTRVGARRRWLNRQGHKASADFEYSQRLQELATSYTVPRPGRQERDYQFGAAYRDEQTDVSRSRGTRLVAAESRRRWNGFTRTLGVQFLAGDFEIAERQRQSTVLFAEGVLNRRRVDDLLYPRQGYAADFGLRFAGEDLGSDTDLAQVWANATWLSPVGEMARFKLRADLGAMSVGQFDALPPELRFFAGGDRSLRGFDYRAIGETGEAGGIVGGEYLAVGSAEYEHYFRKDWGAAVFVDAGDAFTNDFRMNVSAGVGVRWRSPFGVIRLDFARPVRTDLRDSWRVHLLIGPDL